MDWQVLRPSVTQVVLSRSRQAKRTISRNKLLRGGALRVVVVCFALADAETLLAQEVGLPHGFDPITDVQRFRDYLSEHDVLPPIVPRPLLPSTSWEVFADPSSAPRDQRGGLCATFAAVGAMEVQYAINTCEQQEWACPIPGSCARVPACPVRAWDDDPNPDGAYQIPSTANGWALDLSEYMAVVCYPHGWHHQGAGTDSGLLTGFLTTVGTTTEQAYAIRFQFEDWLNHYYWGGNAATAVLHAPLPMQASGAANWWNYGEYWYWEPGPPFALSDDPDPFYGTCPLVDRVGANPLLLPGDSVPPDPAHMRGVRARFVDGRIDLLDIGEYLDPVDPAGAVPLFRMERCGVNGDPADCSGPWDTLEVDPTTDVDEVPLALDDGYVLSSSFRIQGTVDDLASDAAYPGTRWKKCTDDSFTGFPAAAPACSTTTAGCVLDHAVLIVGYEEDGDVLLFRNSWNEPHVWRIRRSVNSACGLGTLDGVSARIVTPIVHYAPCPDPTDCSGPGQAGLRDWMLGDGDVDYVRRAGVTNCEEEDRVPSPDGIANWQDLCLYSSNPSHVVGEPYTYTDGDAWPDGGDGCDNCPDFTTAGRWDSDWDGLGTPCDGCRNCLAPDSATHPVTDASDADFRLGAMWCAGSQFVHGTLVLWPDGRVDECDNCPDVANGDQDDSDHDGLGDACDPCPGRLDEEAVLPGAPDCDPVGASWSCRDNCPWTWNPNQEDEDADGVGDACDRCQGTPVDAGLAPLASSVWGAGTSSRGGYDTDRDTVGDICDLCPLDDPVVSGRAADTFFDSTENSDGPREADTDGDGIGDGCDNCPTVPNLDQANCNAADEDGLVRPLLGDACDPYPCVDLCQEPYGRATFVETPVCDRSTGVELCSTGDRVELDFCAVGFPSGLDATSAAARDGFSLPTQLEGCACRPWEPYSELCSRDCPDSGAGGERWNDILLAGRRVVHPEIDYRPLYGTGALDDGSFSREGTRYGRIGYREYYAGCDVAGWCSTVSGERRVQQAWDWVPDLDGRFPPDEQDESRIAYFWAKPLADTGFAGYPTETGNTYVSRRQRKNEPTLRLFPIPGVGRLRPTFHIREPLDPPPWWEGSAMLAGADLLSLDCEGCEDYRFDNPGLQTAGLVISEWDATNRQYANLVRTRVLQGAFDLIDPAVAIAVGVDGQPSEYWTFGGIGPGGALSDELWHAQVDSQAGVGQAEPVGTMWLAPLPRAESEPWPLPRVGAVLAVRGSISPVPFMTDDSLSLGDGTESSAEGADQSRRLPLVLVGGRGPNGPLGDVWFYDGFWYQVSELPEAAGGLADAAAVSAEGQLWLFGGETGSGPSAGLWQVDLETGKTTRMSQQGPWPSARRSAAMTFDEVRRRLVVFGGLDEDGGSPTDVWAFSLSLGGWTELAPTCIGAGCPAVTGKELAVVDPTRGELTVLADPAGPDREAGSWSLAQGIWQTGKELVSLPDQEDCDGDGVNDLPWGARCGSGSAGFPDYGRLYCDAAAGDLACRLPAKPAVQVASLTVPGLRAVAAADGRVAVLADRRLDIVRVGPAGALATERSVALSRAAYDVALWRNQALVADDAGLVAIRLADGSTAGRVPTCGKARRVLVDGSRAIVVGLRSIVLVGLDASAAPTMLQDLRAYPDGDGDLVVVAGSGCSSWYSLVDFVCEVTGACTWSRRLPSTFSDHRLLINQLLRTYELDFTAAPPALPMVVEDIRTGFLRSIHFESPYLYTNGVAGASAVYDRRSDAGWEYAGGHDVSLWVQGSAATAGYRFLADGDVLRMAEEQ